MIVSIIVSVFFCILAFVSLWILIAASRHRTLVMLLDFLCYGCYALTAISFFVFSKRQLKHYSKSNKLGPVPMIAIGLCTILSIIQMVNSKSDYITDWLWRLIFTATALSNLFFFVSLILFHDGSICNSKRLAVIAASFYLIGGWYNIALTGILYSYCKTYEGDSTD